MRLIEKFSYRPEVDGLRAIAVIAVVLFHSGFGVSGGFIGVDVFFVISGYLITSLIWKDLENQRFTFRGFWERRARRILPALIFVTITVLIAAWFLISLSDLEALGKATIAQALFAANIYYWKNTGYFGGAAEEQPLLHTWSLAVEEQFYLFVPFLLVGLFRLAVLRERKFLLLILGLGFVCSLALSALGVRFAPSATFYLLPTRAWELLLGSLIAFLPRPHGKGKNQVLLEVVSIAGIVLIIIPCFTYSSTTPFPGFAALVPTLGTAAIIWSSRRGSDNKPTRIAALLSIRPVVFIGLISYSWYLWHWPILAFVRYLASEPISFAVRTACLVAGLLLAIASWKFVEQPCRRSSSQRSGDKTLIYSLSALVIIVMIGLLLSRSSEFSSKMPADSDKVFTRGIDTDDIRSGRLTTLGDTKKIPTLLVWGDSHAMAVLPAVDEMLKKYGLGGCAATHSSTAPILGWYKNSKYGLNEQAPEFNESVLAYVLSNKIEAVLLHATWRSYATSPNVGELSFSEALYDTVKRLRNAGVKVYFLLDVPIHSKHIPRLLANQFETNGANRPDEFSIEIPQHGDGPFDAIDPHLIGKLRNLGAVILDPKPLFLSSDGTSFKVYSDGIVLYRDTRHLTSSGARHMLGPFLDYSFGRDLSLHQKAIDADQDAEVPPRQ